MQGVEFALTEREDDHLHEPPVHRCSEEDESFSSEVEPCSSRTQSTPSRAKVTGSLSSESEFPTIPIRYGDRALNVDVMTAVIHFQATSKVSDNDVLGICVDLANMVFGQSWKKEREKEETKSDDEDVVRGKEGKMQDFEEDFGDKRDLTYVFPSRKTRRRWLKHAAILNLRHVANQIVFKSPGEVVTMGFDDTTKAACVRLFDVKATNITIGSESKYRKTFTTGFTPNISHKGVDQAETRF